MEIRNVMDVGDQSVLRYRARAARRPFLFWWQAFLLLAVSVFLWSQLPLTAVLFEARVISPLPEAHAAYVVLDANYAAQAFKKSLTAWTSGGMGGIRVSGMEIGGIDLSPALQPPEYLEQGERYPGVWQPSAVSPLPIALPEMQLSSAESGPLEWPACSPTPGVRVEPDEALKRAAFTFPLSGDALPERVGHCRYYVETEKDGTVVHVLLLTPRTPGGAAFERMLLRGRASCAARGSVDIFWMFPKS